MTTVTITPMSQSINNGRAIESTFASMTAAHDYFNIKCDELGLDNKEGGRGYDYRIELTTAE